MGWITAGAAVVGPAHRHAGRGCEDAFLVSTFGGHCLLAAVADGAGSALRAADGAACVVNAACATMRAWCSVQPTGWTVADITDAVAYGWLQAVRATVEAYAIEQTVPLGDFAATCLFVLADSHNVVALQIGDGGIALRSPQGSWSPLTWPLRGEYANETVFITSAEWQETAQIVRGGTAAALAIFSDGFEILALNYREHRVNDHLLNPLADFLGTVSLAVVQADLDAAMVGYLSNATFDEHAFDDRTLVIACQSPPPPKPSSSQATAVLNIFPEAPFPEAPFPKATGS